MMRLCNKCTILKPIENFASYIHKRTGNTYTRHICTECFNLQTKEYKKSIKPRTCIECNETKEVKQFPNYKSIGANDKRHNICKKCTTTLEKQRKAYKYNKRELNGEPVLDKPNTYRTEQQRVDGFELMQVLGFTFNEENGIWFKEGVKNPDGSFIRIIEKKRLQKERRLKEIEELDIWKKIRYLREQGNSINDISTITGINRTAVQKFLYNGKEIKLRN
jgi:hypothetical protein